MNKINFKNFQFDENQLKFLNTFRGREKSTQVCTVQSRFSAIDGRHNLDFWPYNFLGLYLFCFNKTYIAILCHGEGQLIRLQRILDFLVAFTLNRGFRHQPIEILQVRICIIEIHNATVFPKKIILLFNFLGE